MADFDDMDEEDEVEVRIEPREDVLARHGISPEDFEDALGRAIDEYHATIESLADEDDAPAVGEMTVRVAGREFRLDELADVQISDESE